ncbi:MAG: ATP-dependent helicase [Treponema sp.]|nr:ATP-dependent helicase [Treponema sp.]
MDSSNLLASLFEQKKFKPNENQLKAIQHTDGPLLLTAGPGSGKTRVLLWRTLYLIMSYEVDPGEIFLSTFTEKAALQLKQGLRELLDIASSVTGKSYDISEMYVGTLHSLCQKILKDSRFNASGTSAGKAVLLDELDQFFFVSRYANWMEILKAGGYESDEQEDFLEFYREINSWFSDSSSSKINAVKNCISFFNRMSEEDFSNEDLLSGKGDGVEQKLFKMTVRYRTLLDEQKPGKMDFASLQRKALSVILSSKGYGNVFRHVIVDEYQDTNTIQRKVYMALASGTKNICVVGDDDQALYRFRGATVENLIDFENICERCIGVRPTRIDLNINYRSRKQIVETYKAFMENCAWTDEENNTYRIADKNIRAFSGDEDCAVIRSVGSKEEVTGYVASLVKALKSQSVIDDYNQCAFLFPTLRGSYDGMSASVKAYADAFTAAKIPYYAPKARSFLYTDEALVTFGLFAAIFDIVPDLETTLGGMKKFNEWIQEVRTVSLSVLMNDPPLLEIVESKIKEVDEKKSQFEVLKAICAENGMEVDDEADGSELEILLSEKNLERLSDDTATELSSYRLREYVRERAEENQKVTISYILSKATSVDWNLLDLFYDFGESKWYRDEFAMAKNGDDAGMYNLGLITQYISRYMEMHSSVLSGKNFEDDAFASSFFYSFLYTIFRMNEGEYENEETPFPSGAVPFLTVHQSKGLEFPVVVLGSVMHRHKNPRPLDVLVRKMEGEMGSQAGMNEPLEMMDDYDTMRMFYVALSRAKNLLVISQFRGPGQTTYPAFEKLFAEKEIGLLGKTEIRMPKSTSAKESEEKSYSFKYDYLSYLTCPRNYMAFKKYGFVPSRSQTMFYGSLVLRTIRDFQDYIKGESLDEGN